MEYKIRKPDGTYHKQQWAVKVKPAVGSGSHLWYACDACLHVQHLSNGKWAVSAGDLGRDPAEPKFPEFDDVAAAVAFANFLEATQGKDK